MRDRGSGVLTYVVTADGGRRASRRAGERGAVDRHRHRAGRQELFDVDEMGLVTSSLNFRSCAARKTQRVESDAGSSRLRSKLKADFLAPASWMGVWTSRVGRLCASRLSLTTANCARARARDPPRTLSESWRKAGVRLQPSPIHCFHFIHSSTRQQQMSLERTLSALATLAIEPKGSLTHAATSDPASWRAALDGSPPSTSAAVPSSYKLTKTLIFKPRTAKTATPVPVVLIASDETDTKNSTALAKSLNQKELRLAGDELIQEFFALDKGSRVLSHRKFFCGQVLIGSTIAVSPLSISADIFPKVITVLDSAISASEQVFAVRASTSEATIFLHGTDISKYLSSLESSDTKLQIVDFAALKAEPVGAAPTKSTPNKKQEAKIEDAHQLAIGAKKEVDFATWYTNVR